MLADASYIVAVALLLGAVGGFLAILLTRRAGRGCGCSCAGLVCPPRPGGEAAEPPSDPTAPRASQEPERTSGSALSSDRPDPPT